MRDYGDGGVGYREIDDNIGVRFANDAKRNADVTNAGDQAGIFSQKRMVGRLERRDHLKSWIFHCEGRNPLTHPPRGPMNC
jgi:hypothetical protein